MKKTVYTLNIGNYAPEICALTYPFMRRYARKIGAEFVILTEKKFPGWPMMYEKFQLFTLGRANDWNIYIDSDALLHPDLWDVTEHIDKGTVMHYGYDRVGSRWKWDDYMRRDGRALAPGNFFSAVSDWCLDFWHPLEDMSLEQAVGNISPMVEELNKGVAQDHLLDDYLTSRNLARYGLHCKSFQDQVKELGRTHDNTIFHTHVLPAELKRAKIEELIHSWGLTQLPEGREAAGSAFVDLAACFDFNSDSCGIG
jgi:hypothetical protein